MASGGIGNTSSSASGGVQQGKSDKTGSTTAAFATLFTNTNSNGVIGIGTLKNTDGINTLTARETVIDAFGSTTVVTTDVLPGRTYMLDPQTDFAANGKPPYSSYKLEVQDKVAASHATFEMHYTGLGTVV